MGPFFSQERHLRRTRLAPIHAVVLTAMLLPATGCSSWHDTPGLDAAALVQQPSRVRLRLTSGQRIELRQVLGELQHHRG